MTDKKESFGPGLVLKYTYPTQAADRNVNTLDRSLKTLKSELRR